MRLENNGQVVKWGTINESHKMSGEMGMPLVLSKSIQTKNLKKKLCF